MSIASEITRINTNIAAAYTACGDKGATMPQTQNSQNLADTIAGIPQSGGATDLDGYIQGTLSEITSNAASVKSSAFRYDSYVASISLPAATSIGTSAFNYCSALQSVSVPSAVNVLSNSFQNCGNLRSVTLGDIESLGISAFGYCALLPMIDLKNISEIKSETFRSCTSLSVIILRRTTLCTLGNVDALASTPFRNGRGGTAYVPQALVSTYQNATNWSALESVTFLPIEGSIYE